jgi:hypothetical protein
MKTEDILNIISLVRDRAEDVKSILDDVQRVSNIFADIATGLAELSKLAKGIVVKIEGLKR